MGHFKTTTSSRANQNRFWMLIILFTVVYLSDLALTLYGLSSGLLIEANPLMHWLLDHGICMTVLLKLGLLGAFIAVFSFCTRVNPRLAVSGTITVLVPYSCIVLYHLASLAY